MGRPLLPPRPQNTTVVRQPPRALKPPPRNLRPLSHPLTGLNTQLRLSQTQPRSVTQPAVLKPPIPVAALLRVLATAKYMRLTSAGGRRAPLPRISAPHTLTSGTPRLRFSPPPTLAMVRIALQVCGTLFPRYKSRRNKPART